MKVLLLADADSSHTVKWARSFADKGLEVAVWSLRACDARIYRNHPGISLHSLGIRTSSVNAYKDFSKLGYLRAVPKIRGLIARLGPDIVHSHYATSYGLLGAFSGFHPHILSVWGSDIYEFPRKGFLHEAMLRFNLARADRILSTSRAMADETRRYTSKPIEVTPFGIDLDVFKPRPADGPFGTGDIVIGTVKTLEANYGVEYLVKAFGILKARHADLPLKLLIVGGGTKEADLKALVRKLGLEEDAVFTGYVGYDDVPRYHNMLTVYVSVSRSESFGVAVIEASACERPVVVSNVGGLPEVVEDGKSGFIVSPKDAEQTADALERLILDEGLRVRMGRAGRARVRELFEWKSNVARMIEIYRETISRAGSL